MKHLMSAVELLRGASLYKISNIGPASCGACSPDGETSILRNSLWGDKHHKRTLKHPRGQSHLSDRDCVFLVYSLQHLGQEGCSGTRVVLGRGRSRLWFLQAPLSPYLHHLLSSYPGSEVFACLSPHTQAESPLGGSG